MTAEAATVRMDAEIVRDALQRMPSTGGAFRMRAPALAALDRLLTERAEREQEARSLTERVTRAMAGLTRLASMEGFEGAGWVGGDSFCEREIRARGRYAEKVLADLAVGESAIKPAVDQAQVAALLTERDTLRLAAESAAPAQYMARAQTAEARVAVLEQALREIAENTEAKQTDIPERARAVLAAGTGDGGQSTSSEATVPVARSGGEA